MKATHTPGPWRIETGKFFWGDCPVIMAQAHMLVATMSTQPGRELNANGQRIVACVNACQGLNPAAVPAMVEALRDLIQADEVSGPTWSPLREKAHAALAKAKEVA